MLYKLLLVLSPRRFPVMLSMETHWFQKYISAGETVEHEFTKIRADRGGADEAHQRRPPQLRHGPQRGESGYRPSRHFYLFDSRLVIL